MTGRSKASITQSHISYGITASGSELHLSTSIGRATIPQPEINQRFRRLATNSQNTVP